MRGGMAGSLRPLGCSQYVGVAAASLLTATPTSGVTIPRNVLRVVISVETQPIRYTDDGALTPTAAVGILIPTNSLFIYDGDPYAFKMIQTAASATVNVAYYG